MGGGRGVVGKGKSNNAKSVPGKAPFSIEVVPTSLYKEDFAIQKDALREGERMGGSRWGSMKTCIWDARGMFCCNGQGGTEEIRFSCRRGLLMILLLVEELQSYNRFYILGLSDLSDN